MSPGEVFFKGVASLSLTARVHRGSSEAAALHEHRRPSSRPSRDRNFTIVTPSPPSAPISRTELRHIGRVFQVVSQRRFEFPRAMAMNDAQERRASQCRAIQRRNHVIQRLVRRLPSNIHDRRLVESQSAA